MALGRSGPGVDGRARSLLGRRDWLTRVGCTGLALAAAGGTGLLLRPLWPRPEEDLGSRVRLGPLSELLPGTVDERLLAEHWIWVVRTKEVVYGLHARCTHLGCKLRLDRVAGLFRCMCHGSVFSLEGEVLRGPAPRPMERVYIALVPDGVLVLDPAVRYRPELMQDQGPGALIRPARGRSRGAAP